MRGNKEIIEILNEVLTAELTAINQYFLHAMILQDWGFNRLAEHSRHESIDEMKHAEEVTGRVLLLEGIPNYQRYFPLRIGETVPEILEADLALEYEAIERLNKGVKSASEANDNGSRELFERILIEEEAHADWIETQLELIKQIGVEHYLAGQMHGGG